MTLDLPDALRRRFKGLSRMVPGLLAAMMVVVLMKLGAWAPLERLANSDLMRWRGPRLWDSRIVMISIDDKTLNELGQFPISREYYVNLVRLLTEEESSVIVFNMLFSDNSTASDGGTADRQANARLAAEMATHGRVVIGQAWGSDPESEPIQPVPVLADTAIATGHLRLPVDPDGLTRFAEITVDNVPTLGIAAIQAYSLDQNLVSIPTDKTRLDINWPASARDLATLSFVDILNGQFPPTYLKDKIVIVGYGATAGKAPMRTPFDTDIEVQGGYMHAAVIDNLLGQSWLRPVPKDTVILAVLMLGPLFNSLIYRRRLLSILAVSGGLSIAWLLLCTIGLKLNLLLPIMAPLVTLWSTGACVLIVDRIQSRTLLQVRSAFLNTMSHEIRTPLNAIVNLSEMLQETPLNNQQQEYAETLFNSSQTLLALINDVLDFSKIEAGQLMIEECPVHLSDVIERSIELVAPRAVEKGLELVYAISPQTPAVILSDPVRIQQILLNLLSNAVKFTESGEVAIKVTAHPISPSRALLSPRRLKPQAWFKPTAPEGSPPLPPPPPQPTDSRYDHRLQRYKIRFQVSDTGIGIPPEQVSQLFKPFSQVSASTSRQYGGTGLGLSISKRLSERLGGEMWVKSQVGKGSRFYFTVQAPAAEVVRERPQPVAPPAQTLCILLIDRNDTRQERLTVELERYGIDVISAQSLLDALVQLQSAATIDGILLDEGAGDPTESTAADIDALRTAAEDPQLPVILLSTLNSQVPDEVTLSSILWKPIKRTSLYQALQTLPQLSHPPLLPSSPPEPTQQLANQPSAQIKQDNTTARHPTRILIAEDNVVNQRVALRVLELLGYSADVAGSGAEVLTALKHQTYDVILMDMRMPELDGIETTRHIRSQSSQRNIWIIAMTANAMEEDRRRCLAAGMNDYLTKPIKRAALAQALENCPAVQQHNQSQIVDSAVVTQAE